MQLVKQDILIRNIHKVDYTLMDDVYILTEEQLMELTYEILKNNDDNKLSPLEFIKSITK